MSDHTKNDHDSRRPAYQQIADTIAARIANGQYTYKLPSQRNLAKELNVSRSTVQHATKILTERGLIASIYGRATYLAQYVRPYP